MALTRWPRMSITERSVCRNALRASAFSSGPQGARDRLQVDAGADAALAQARPAVPQPAEHARVDRERQQRRHPRQRGRAQQRADLLAEAAARDQRQPLHALGELVEELHRHAAAERVPDDRRAIDPDRGEQVADAGGVGAERVVAARRRGVAVADEVGRDDGVVARRAAMPRPASGCEELSIPWMSTTGGPSPATR